ncbi:MAG: DnaB-like helicase C-terminal domain-containing protein, partial [Christensenellaceae bacterium]|nr:DnaB-like helicase C-terminal domain-containing protein [Christensenellaceae bacterium]
RPSVGKTAFALTVAINAAIRNNKKVAVFSFEMPTVQLVQRMLTTLSQVSFKRQKKPGMLNFNETTRLVNAHEALSNSKIFVDENSGNTPADIISKCRRMKNTVGLDLVIIDYLQLITLGEKKENRQQEVSEMSRKMKLFAKELGVPFLVLSQLSRGTEQRGEEPQLSDLRESGSIEQDADMVMFLHRPKKVENPKSEESKFAASYDDDGDHKFVKMIVAKNRNGETGNVYFDWCGDMQTFKPIDIRELSTTETKEPAAKVNPDITSLEQIKNDDEIFSDMVPVEEKGTVEEIMDDGPERATINEPPFDFSHSDGLTFVNNESGDQSINHEDNLPF